LNEAGSETSILPFFVVVTACPTGIAHTFMAAESLELAAREMNIALRIETQGAAGTGSPLTKEEIQAADLVLIAADRVVDRSRFAGKWVLETSAKEAIVSGNNLLRRAANDAVFQEPAKPEERRVSMALVLNAVLPVWLNFRDKNRGESGLRTNFNFYRHLMTGVSFMLPFAVIGGLCTALAYGLGGIEAEGRLSQFLLILGNQGFSLMTPILAGFIARSISGRPGIAPGIIGGILCNVMKTGFWGGIFGGFIAGFTVYYLNRFLRLPKSFGGLKPVLILPVAGTFITGFFLYFMAGLPLAALHGRLTLFLNSLRGFSSAGLGILLGCMMALDLGGPVNKIAFAFALGLLGSGVSGPMAAVMAGGMTPPLGAALASFLFRSRFNPAERKAGGIAFVLGLVFNSEGAIPFAVADPFRSIPSFIAGSALAGALSMSFNCKLMVPHGGIFAILIPGGVNDAFHYLLAIAAGSLLSGLLLGFLKLGKKPVPVSGET
jgi:PTS system fructose-specific IIC component